MSFPLLIICVLSLRVFSISTSNNCSSIHCNCTDLGDGTWAVDCSKRNISSMPIFQMNVSKIDLSHNNLTEVGLSPPLPFLLRELNMYKNKLKSISTLAFQNLTNMTLLNLAGNYLWWDDSPTLSFIENLSNLRSLNILNNTNSKSNVSYPVQSFKNLEKLESLKIDGLWRGDFNMREWNFTSLTSLTISGKTGKCYFEELYEGFFGGLLNLRFLDITGCPIRSIYKDVFSSLHSLHTLDLSNNENMTFVVLENVSYDLQFTNVQIFNVSKIHCALGLGTYLSKNQFIHFRNTSITHLDLSGNRIELMDVNVPKYFPPNMTFLNISKNHLTWGMYILQYQFLTNLTVADFSKQTSDDSEDLPSVGCENPIDCSFTNDEDSDNQKEDLSNGILYPQSVLGSSKRNITFYIPPKLEKIFFHHTNFLFTVREVHLRNNHCKEYHLQNSIIHSLIGPMYGMEYAVYLDFSGNLMYDISQSFFQTLPNVTYLNLSNNLLGNCFHENIMFDHFQALKKLKEINLSNNGISSLPPKFLQGAWSLESLDLSNNLITNFTITLNESSLLKHLDLSANRLHEISRETMHRLQSIHERNNLTVDLSENMFDCTCEALFFLQWIQDSKIRFIKKNQYSCKTSHSRVRTFSELSNILNDLKQECSSNIPRTISITVSVVAILTIGVVSTLFRFRWTVRYFYYLTKWKIQEIVNPSKQNRKNYKYSAFVSYTEKDSFVERDLVHQLEEMGGLKLCLPNRDFYPNLKRCASVTHAIHNSKKILCIVTTDFLKDSWCMYQLQMALEDRTYREDEDCIIFILLKAASFEDLGGIQQSLLVMPFIEKNSYALYPQNEADQFAFWQKLIDTIKK